MGCHQLLGGCWSQQCLDRVPCVPTVGGPAAAAAAKAAAKAAAIGESPLSPLSQLSQGGRRGAGTQETWGHPVLWRSVGFLLWSLPPQTHP